MADESAPVYDEVVNQQKNGLSILDGIGREILILLSTSKNLMLIDGYF